MAQQSTSWSFGNLFASLPSLGGPGGFQYELLPNANSFRVVELLPGIENQQLECRLVVAGIGNAPSYEAISYCWGNPRLTNSIKCHEKNLKITANLFGALKRFRLPDQIRTLWTDGLSINQGDLSERSQQVQRMGQIYRNASRVLVWLGDEKNDDDDQIYQAFDLIDIIAETCCRKASISLQDLININDMRTIVKHVQVKDLPVEIDDHRFKSLSHLFNLPWFRRLWVVQEVAAGPPVSMTWGCHSRDMDLLSLTTDCLVQWTLTDPILHRIRRSPGVNAVWTMQRSRRNHLKESPNNLLALLSAFETTNPRDKVYAILGLPMFAKAGSHLRVDYGETVKGTYRDFTIGMIKWMRDLSILSMATHEYSIDIELPSWIPDYSRPLRNIQLPPSSYRGKYGAATGLKFSGLEMLDSNTLVCTGIKFDEVVWIWDIGDEMWVEPGYPDEIHPFIAMWHSLTADCSAYPTGEEMDLAYGLTLTLGFHVIEGGVLRNANPEIYLEDFYTWISHARLQAGEEASNGGIIPQGTAKPKQKSRFEVTARYLCSYRCLFRTAKGYFGLGPPAMRLDDLVYILPGGQFPFVLRPAHILQPEYGCFQLIGDCYVHGIMVGEAVQACKHGELEKEVVKLR